MRVARRSTVSADSLRPCERRLLELVSSNPGKVRGWYAEQAGLGPNTVSCYLDILKSAGVVHTKQRGRWATWWTGKRPKEAVKLINSVWVFFETRR